MPVGRAVAQAVDLAEIASAERGLGLEATGGFERLVVAAIAACGIAIFVVNPRQARDFAKATGRLAKTDSLDALVLARFAQAIRPTPRAIPDQEAREFAEILARRRQIVRMSNQASMGLGTAPESPRYDYSLPNPVGLLPCPSSL
jgi:transposase